MSKVSTWDRFIGAVALFMGIFLTLTAPFLTVVLLLVAIPFHALGAAFSSIGDVLESFPASFRDCKNVTIGLANREINRIKFGKGTQK